MKLNSINRGVADIERKCSLCGIDRTPLNGGLYLINDRKGRGLGLFGDCCSQAISFAVDNSPTRYANTKYENEEMARKLIFATAKNILKKN